MAGRTLATPVCPFECYDGNGKPQARPWFGHCLARRPPAERLIIAHAGKDKQPKKRLAVFISGGGSNFRKIHEACELDRINGEVVVVITDNPKAAGVSYARSQYIPCKVYPVKQDIDESDLGELSHEDLLRSELEMVTTVAQLYEVDYVLLAGYLKLVPSALVREFPRRMLNIHPGLLPAFGGKGMYGKRVHKAVIRSGVRFSGPTVHFVDEEYDTGPIIAQRVVPVHPTDTPDDLAARILKEEHEVFPEVVSALCADRIEWRHDGVPFMWVAK